MMLKVFFLFLLQKAFCDKFEVPQYTDKDFNKIDRHDVSMVMFYAPWCGHCKNLKPAYTEAAEELSKNKPPVHLLKVDCTESGKSTCDKYKISGYPTLKLFRNGKYHKDYNGPRTSNGIIDFMKSYGGPKYKHLTSTTELSNFTSNNQDVRVLASGNEEFKRVFLEVVEALWEKVNFAWSSLLHEDKLVLYRPKFLKNKFEEDEVKYEGKATTEEIKEFILKNYHGLAGVRNPENKDDFKPPLVVAYYEDSKLTRYWRNRVLKVAQHYKDKLTFAVSSLADFQDDLSEYGLENFEGEKPIVIAIDADKKKYLMEDVFSFENLTKFVDGMLEKKLAPKIKSEEIPLVNDGPVKVAVAKNFEQVVMDNGKDTVLAFYAPWCGVCKKLAPVYDEFAKKMTDEEVEVVKMDATANEVPKEFKIDGYPTVYWLAKDEKKEPVLYEGNKELNDLIKYVAKHATHELKSFDRDGNVKIIKTEL